MLLVLDWPGDKSVLWWFNMILIKIITIYAVVNWMMVFNRYLKFWLLYNDMLVALAIEQRRISKGSSPAPHQWRLPPPSSRISCLAAWTQVLMLILVINCVFFFASMLVVEIFSHSITACDLIFSFPGLWLFLRYSHIWKCSLATWTQVFLGLRFSILFCLVVCLLFEYFYIWQSLDVSSHIHIEKLVAIVSQKISYEVCRRPQSQHLQERS